MVKCKELFRKMGEMCLSVVAGLLSQKYHNHKALKETGLR
jgi:hypothetical protein